MARRLEATIGVCLIIGGAALALTLSQSPITVIHVSTAAAAPIGALTRAASACQSGEALPGDTSAIRLRVFAVLGPRVVLEELQAGHVIAHGERSAGWTGGAVTVPVNSLSRTRAGVELCFRIFLNGDETSYLTGEQASGAGAARGYGWPPSTRLRVEYLRRASYSWWSRIPEVARRMGLGRAWAGTWVALFVLALMGGVVALCSRLILRELG